MVWMQDLVAFAASQMPNQAREALWARGATDDQIKTFQVGYLNKKLPQGLPVDFLKWSRYGDKLDSVFVFPLTTTLGEIRGLQFRHVQRDRLGYMDFFLDRREPCLFGLHQAVESMWTTHSVFLVEGCFDLFPVQKALPFVVTTLTSHASGQTARFLRRVTQKVWVGYDMDEAGRKGCEEFKKRYKSWFEVYIVSYPTINNKQMKDPGDLWEAWGDGKMTSFIQSVLKESNPFC